MPPYLLFRLGQHGRRLRCVYNRHPSHAFPCLKYNIFGQSVNLLASYLLFRLSQLRCRLRSIQNRHRCRYRVIFRLNYHTRFYEASKTPNPSPSITCSAKVNVAADFGVATIVTAVELTRGFGASLTYSAGNQPVAPLFLSLPFHHPLSFLSNTLTTSSSARFSSSALSAEKLYIAV